jgi:hypothetical protein
VESPLAREGRRFALLFEQMVMSLACVIPVNTAARHIKVTDKLLRLIVRQYVTKPSLL